jgi:hypothetical protein
VDSYNNIFFSEVTFNRIRRIDAVTGIVTTICGTGASTSTGDGGPAISATLNVPYLICCDKANNLYFPKHRVVVFVK